MSLIVVGAEKWLMGAPIFHAITPATRLPKLPDGTETTSGVCALSCRAANA